MDKESTSESTRHFDGKTAMEYSGNQFFEKQIVSRSSRGKEENFTGADWLGVNEAALYLRMLSRDGRPCAQRVRNLVSQGRLPFYKPFGRLLFKRSELRLLIESSRKGVLECR